MRQKLLKYILSAALLFIVNTGFSQPWMNKFNECERPNFFEIQKAFYDYWNVKGIDVSKINTNNLDPDESGELGEYIQYKRWEWYASHRIEPTGEFPEPMIAFNERNKIQSNSEKRMKNINSLVANWSSMGPSVIPSKGGEGRANCVAVNPLDSNKIYVGSPSGGFWKSIDGGNSWTATGDYLSTLGVTDIAVDPVDTNIIYIATGDGDVIYTYSTGVMKSTDGGMTWNTTGFSWQVNQGYFMNRIIVNPDNHNMVLVGTYLGISKSLDGGTSWTTSLSGHRIFDIQIKPGNSSVVYASNYNSIFKSTDSGSTFTNVYTSVGVNRIELAVTPANVNYLYALESDSANSGFHALVRSTDGGNNFTQMSTTPNILGASPLGNSVGGQGWGDLAIAASPVNANTIVTGGINIWISFDGGVTWTNKSKGTVIHNNPVYVHSDIHKLTFLPGSPSSVLAACDGGMFRSVDTATVWKDYSAGLDIMEMYSISSSQTNSTVVTSGVQDNGSNMYSNGTWSELISGDGMMTIVDYSNANTIYSEEYYGKLFLSTNGGTSYSTITPNSGNVSGAWVTPYVIDKNTNTTLFAGYNDIWKTTNQGTSWAQITNNLTGNSTYLIMALAIAPSNSNYLYAGFGANTGSNDIYGTYLFKTANSGGSWSNITAGLPVASAYMSAVAIKATDPLTVWVTFYGYNASYKVYKTINGGITWTNVTSNLPNVPVDCIVYDQTSNNDRVFIGTDIGVFYTDNTQGGNWVSFNSGLPDVMVYSMDIQASAGLLRIGTFGRGLWQTDLNSTGLPIELLNFSGKYNVATNSNDLYWSTASEFNNNYFEVMKSADAKYFSSIGKVSGVGNSNQLNNYNFTDKTSINGTNYYYLRQVDFDGNVSISNAILICGNEEGKMISLYPNPASNTIQFQFLRSNAIYDLEVFNETGKQIVMQQAITVGNEENNSIDISSLASGIYFLKITDKISGEFLYGKFAKE